MTTLTCQPHNVLDPQWVCLSASALPSQLSQWAWEHRLGSGGRARTGRKDYLQLVQGEGECLHDGDSRALVQRAARVLQRPGAQHSAGLCTRQKQALQFTHLAALYGYVKVTHGAATVQPSVVFSRNPLIINTVPDTSIPGRRNVFSFHMSFQHAAMRGQSSRNLILSLLRTGVNSWVCLNASEWLVQLRKVQGSGVHDIREQAAGGKGRPARKLRPSTRCMLTWPRSTMYTCCVCGSLLVSSVSPWSNSSSRPCLRTCSHHSTISQLFSLELVASNAVLKHSDSSKDAIWQQQGDTLLPDSSSNSSLVQVGQ